jgi:hypothetical protein
MKTYLKVALAFGTTLVFLSACTPAAQEAFLRGLSQAYSQRSQNPYVSPLGRASESFAAGFLSTMADAARQQRLARESYEISQQGSQTYSRQDEQAYRQQLRVNVIKAREEIEQFLKADRDVFRQWIDFLPGWNNLLESYGAIESQSPHYAHSKKLYDDTVVLDSRAGFYLGSLPAYVHENMDVERVRTEIQDYLSKRENLMGKQKTWNEEINALAEEAKKQEEKIKRIEAEQRGF